MTICAARRDSDPDAITCNSALGGGKAVCACRVEVEAAIKAAETRKARVPDSAREAG